MPDLAAGYGSPFPDRRPFALQRRAMPAGTELWRVDAAAPADWRWSGFPEPKYRFDPRSGAFRTRYASTALVGAFRERYRPAGLLIPADHRHHHVVRLVATRKLSVLDLRTERNLDALGVDDQISTGQHAVIWDACHRLADAARHWWSDLDAIVYRSRTTPESSLNVAFFGSDAYDVESRELGGHDDLLADLVLHHEFTVAWDLG